MAGGWYTSTYDESVSSHLIYGASDSFETNHLLQIIATATEVSALWLLPSAYYELSTYPSKDILPFLEGNVGLHVGKALAARTDLIRGTIAVHDFLNHFEPCKTPKRCGEARKFASRELLDKLSGHELDPITWNVKHRITKTLKALSMCGECRDSAKKRVDKAACDFWDELPGVFDLPTWQELHTMKKAAMGEEDSDEETSESDSSSESD
ncbi:hypothetical protein R3P38DRAFT_224211 [Favolaschia claudopus]|uniref:Uncharacterized protein n=1 Tax=Favolaschia claudopus TaxID=2862362 RepID=A0AAV9ZUI9_9AGAR